MIKTVTRDTLSESVDFNSPFRSLGDGRIETGIGIFAPESPNGSEIEEPGQRYFVPCPSDANWELLSGYSGQYLSPGPIMHDSEYLGARMAQDVLDEEGVYCLLAVEYENDDEEMREVEPTVIEGWVLARLKEEA